MLVGRAGELLVGGWLPPSGSNEVPGRIGQLPASTNPRESLKHDP